MSKSPPNYIGTHHYKWKPRETESVPRREKNLAVYRDLERRKYEQHLQNLIKCGHKIPLSPAQEKSGARRVA